MTVMVSCRALRTEAERALANLGINDVVMVDCRGQCRHSSLGAKDKTWIEELGKGGQDLLVVCRCPADRSVFTSSQPRIVQLDNIEELFIAPEDYQALLDNESFVVTSGWLLNWRANLKRMDLDKAAFDPSAGGTVKEVVMIDTLPDSSAAHELVLFAGHIGLPYRIIKGDLRKLEELMASLAHSRMSVAEMTAVKARLDLSEKAMADYAMTFDVLSTISQAHGESMVISSIMSLFEMLFAPRAVRYSMLEGGKVIGSHSTDDTVEAASDLSWMNDGKMFTETANGFALVIPSNDQAVGVVEVMEIGFPENRQRYLNLALSIRGALGLAITNARAIENVKRSEEEARRRSEELEGFFGLELGLLAITSMDGRLIRVNRGWESTLWYTVGQLEGTSYLDYIHPDDIPATLTAMKDLTEQKEVLHFTNRYRRADGIYRWIEWYAIPHGNYVYAQARDVTERKQMEDALQQAYAKLNILSSITRHDVNNQLTALLGNLELMGAMKLGPAAEQRIQRSKAAVDNISSMIQFTKLYEEVGIKAPQWHELRTLVGNSVREVQLGHIKVVNDIPAGIEVFADPLISKVFYNLAHNAIRHGGDLTQINFSLEETEAGLIIACQDDGVGLTPESRETLFMKGRGKDHGFGLYLSKEILAITKIGIRENGQGRKGARFEVIVPPGGWRRTA